MNRSHTYNIAKSKYVGPFDPSDPTSFYLESLVENCKSSGENKIQIEAPLPSFDHIFPSLTFTESRRIAKWFRDAILSDPGPLMHFVFGITHPAVGDTVRIAEPCSAHDVLDADGNIYEGPITLSQYLHLAEKPIINQPWLPRECCPEFLMLRFIVTSVEYGIIEQQIANDYDGRIETGKIFRYTLNFNPIPDDKSK